MEGNSPRRLNLMDLIILIAGAAGGFALGRRVVVTKIIFGYSSLRYVLDVVETCAIALTIAVLAIGLRQPRPAWPRLRKQPGFVACLAIVFSVVFDAFNALPFFCASAFHEVSSTVRYASLLGSIVDYRSRGPAVLAAWSALVLSGAWSAGRGRRGVIGRSG